MTHELKIAVFALGFAFLLAGCAPKMMREYQAPTTGEVSTVVFADAKGINSIVWVFPNKECIGPYWARSPHDASGNLVLTVPRNQYTSFRWTFWGKEGVNSGSHCDAFVTLKPTEGSYVFYGSKTNKECTTAASRGSVGSIAPTQPSDEFAIRKPAIAWTAEDAHCE
jgi:hypothetical protein